MAWTKPLKRALEIGEFKAYVENFSFSPWKPSGMVLHNTGSPSLAQRPYGFLATHMDNLEDYFKNIRKWSGAPHLFIDEDEIWLFNPMNRPGVHSPSWNGTHLGVELLGDFSREDDDSGRGLRVKNMAVAAFGILHARLGLDPAKIKFHKDDPKTTHDCPGKDLYEDKDEFIEAVREYMGSGGDWTGMDPHEPPHPPPSSWGKVVRVPKGDNLNVRAISSTRGAVLEHLDNGDRVEITGSAMNGTTKWLGVITADRTVGWVSAAYIQKE